MMRSPMLAAAGLVLIVIGERVLQTSAISWVGALTLAAATLNTLRARSAIARLRVSGYLMLDAAMLVYGASTETGLDLLRVPVGHPLQRALEFSWLAILLAGALTLVAVEVRARELAPHEGNAGLDAPRRVAEAGMRALALALAIIGVVALNVAADAREMRVDLSYSQITEPSDATLRMVRALGESVQVVLLYPEGNEVHERLRPFFDTLEGQSELLTVERIDHALAPALASQHRLSGNGHIALIRGEGDDAQSETIEVGQELGSSRSKLRTLDGHFQEAFSRLTQPRRELHLTVGHDERKMSGDEQPDQRLERFVQTLRRSNIAPREFGLATGLAQVVPQSVPMVAIAGPRAAFAPEEMEALLTYVRGGGRLLVLVDHEAGGGLDPLLAGLGLVLEPGDVLSEQHFVPTSRTIADRARIYTTLFAQHPTVRTAKSQVGRNAVVFAAGAALAPILPAPDRVTIVFPLRTENSTWRDLDGDLAQGQGEPSETLRMMAAVSVRNATGNEGRVVVIGESSFASNDLVGYRGNFRVLGDVLQWLLGDLGQQAPIIVGATTSREDHPMEYNREEDAVIFYATSFAVPVPLLVFGLIMVRQRRRRREGPAGSGSDSGAEEEE